ncbi:hypothetical protein OA251_00510 [Prochlorococcus sp. AH-716-P08]|nr:hypothetical protein [Prochlorococcus sp. AH-716-P08]
MIYISSIGPINHPDAADYHVGYPYQYFIRGGFFVDGGLTQGLLGLADYSNLAFIQENSSWLIRFIQIANLPLIILFLSKKVKNNIFLLVFLSIPTFIQWSTIGKPLFLGESSMIILYLIWKYNPTKYTLKLLFISFISCISFKISSLIIIFPIFLDIGITLISIKNKRKNLASFLHYLFLSKEFLFTLIAFTSLIINRFIITKNLAYPLLTNIFNKNNEVIKNFASFLSDYERDDFFFIRIFLPTNFNALGQALGPAILLLTIFLFYRIIKNHKRFTPNDKSVNFLCALQFILLMFFCQGRADYYIAPIVLLIHQSNQLINTNENFFIKLSFYLSTTFQISIISAFLFFSIYVNYFSSQEFSKSMNKTAYGFNLIQMINKNISGNFLIQSRNVRLFYYKNYLDKDRFKSCENTNIKLGISNPKEICLKRYKVNQIITFKEDKINEDLFNCKFIKAQSASRNIFNKKINTYKYCRRLNSFD